uniref:hypothetical protein n=1 Tax=Rhizobium meliloti TaxID=382 RepID=UPI002E18C152
MENVAGGAAKPIKPQHHQLVARMQKLHDGFQLGPALSGQRAGHKSLRGIERASSASIHIIMSRTGVYLVNPTSDVRTTFFELAKISFGPTGPISMDKVTGREALVS